MLKAAIEGKVTLNKLIVGFDVHSEFSESRDNRLDALAKPHLC
jgi:hypothetical protein